jgi:large subunit ribosomal protein L3
LVLKKLNMIQALIGKKLTQTQKFLESGRRIPVTEIAVSDNVVLQVKNVEKDGYTSVQLGYSAKKNGTQAVLGHVKKAGLEKAPAVVKEVALNSDDTENLPKIGDLVSVGSVFKPGDVIDVTGTSKGKGFAGVVKRHNFRGGPKTHGQSDRHRAPGSIGQTTTPGRVYKGKRMAGHMGAETVTVTNLTVVDVDEVNKKLYVLGLVPGHKDAYVLITQKGEDKEFVPLLNPVKKENTEEVASNAMETEVSEEATSNVADSEVVVTEEVEAQVSEEVKEAVESVATPELVESVEEKVEEAASDAVGDEVSEEATSDVAETENIEESKEEENGK